MNIKNKKNIFKFKKINFLTIFLTSFPIILTACSAMNTNKTDESLKSSINNENEFKNLNANNNVWDTEIRFGIDSNLLDENQKNSFLVNFKNEFELLKNSNDSFKSLPDVNFSFINLEKKDLVNGLFVDDKNKSLIDFGFVRSYDKFNNDEKNRLIPIFQSTRYAFINDLEPYFYKDGKENDPVIKNAKTLNDLFNKTPFNSWSNLKNGEQKWNGFSYQFLNDPSSKLVDFYRGIIMVAGNKSQYDHIKDVWDKRLYTEFKRNGTIHGEKTSPSRWLAPEKFIINYFNETFLRRFKTLQEDIDAGHPYHFREASSSYLGQNDDFKIAFADQISLIREQNLQNKTQYFSKYSDAKFEILAYTDPIPNDIGSFRENFNQNQAKLIAQTFVKLSEKKLDTYGMASGYDGYKLLNKKDLNNIFNIYKKTFKK